MKRGASSGSATNPTGVFNRRGFLAGAVVLAAAPALAACGTSSASKGPGTTSKSQLDQILPNYIQNTSVIPDIPSVVGAAGAVSDPGFLAYPVKPAQTVNGVPGKGGTYTTMTPLWGAIPPSSGNAYYDAVHQAVGATLKI